MKKNQLSFIATAAIILAGMIFVGCDLVTGLGTTSVDVYNPSPYDQNVWIQDRTCKCTVAGPFTLFAGETEGRMLAQGSYVLWAEAINTGKQIHFDLTVPARDHLLVETKM